MQYVKHYILKGKEEGNFSRLAQTGNPEFKIRLTETKLSHVDKKNTVLLTLITF